MRAPIGKRPQGGFTLLEMVLTAVIVVLLAVIIVPSLDVSAEDARVASVRADLAALRGALERYQVEHGNRYPGEFSELDGVTRTATPQAAARAFAAQLTGHTDARGRLTDARSGRGTLGPYVDGYVLPANPFVGGAAGHEVVVDIVNTDVTARPAASGGSGWKFYLRTGRLVANDGTILADGRTRTVQF